MRKLLALILLTGVCSLHSLRADTVVVFNEIMYHPAVNEPGLEWVELYNQHAVDVDLTGWSITGAINFDFPANAVMKGRSYLIVAVNPASLAAATGLTNVLGPFTGRLGNSGDTLRIRNNSGRVMDEVTYGVDGDWPVGPDGSGVSLAKADRDLASGAAANWRSSAQMGGSPGLENYPTGATVPTGLISYWNFNELAGPALDSIGVNHGTLGSGATRSASTGIGGAISFNGATNAYVNVGPGAANSFKVTAGVTIEAVLLPGWNGSNSAVIFRKALKPPGAYRDTVVANNPLAYWRLNDATAAIADATANAHNGSASVGVQLSQPSLIPTDPANNAIRATGADRITIPGFEKIGSGGYSVEFWVKIHSLPVTCCQNLVGDGESSGDYFMMNYVLGPQQGVVGAIRPHYGPANSPVSMDSATALQAGNVYHIVTTWDTTSSANNAVIYINGVPDRTGTITRNVPAPGTTGANGVYIGHDEREVGDGSYTYDEVALYNYPLKASDVAVHYTAATATNFSVTAGNAVQLAFQNDTNNGQANPPVAPGPVLSFGLTVAGVYSELDMPLDGQSGRPTLADLTNGQPHYVAASYNSATGLKAIFVDGVLRFSTTLSGSVNTDNGADALLGNSEVNGGSPFAGILDEMTFWGRGLSASEVGAHWTAVQAGRSYFAPDTTAPEMKLAFNEVASGTNSDFFAELLNYGTNALVLQGFVLQRDGTNNSEYLFPAGPPLQAGGYLALTSATLGFLPQSGDKLFLLSPDRSKVLDSVVVKQRARARFPEATGPWVYPAASTPGGANTFSFRSEIVINEIMYNHALVRIGTNAPLPSDEEWIELFNRSSNSVDLTGWELDGGISYSFAPGQTIPSGGFLVVAKDTNALRLSYPAIDIVGNFEKKLSGRGDSIVLKDPTGNPANQVRYYTAGRWPEYADGGGSSLELRDPSADSSKAEAWAASDESGKSSWNTYSYKMTAQNIVGPQQWNDLLLGLLSNGECLVDDISVIESPTSAPVEFIANGNFENGSVGWRMVGTHNRSRVEVDPANAANHVLHIISTGPQEHMHNHIETTYAGGRTVVNGREYQISFKAKWLAGNNLLNTRLYFDRVARTSVLPMPSLNGTPGAPNSRLETNIGPTFGQFQHRPVIPQAGQPVTVSVQADDAQGVSSCVIKWSLNGAAWNTASMVNVTNNIYTGTIPGQTSGTIQFYVQASDVLGAVSTYPVRGSNSAALYMVNDAQANLPLAHNIRIILSPANTSFLHALTNVMSNDTLPCTVVYDENRAYYDMGVRLKGSERGRYSDTRVSFHLEFNPDDLFRGVHPVMLIDRSGAGDSTANKQQEILIRHILLHAGNVPGPQPDLCRLIAPLSAHTGPGILSPRHEDQFVETAYDHGADGTIYELELVYYPTSADPGGYKLPQPDNVVGVDISNLGTDKEQYRYDFILKNHRDVDDYGPMMLLGQTFSLAAGSALDIQSKQVMDVDEWLRAFAVVSLCGVGDSYTFGNNHNLLMYVRPSDGRMLAFPWDMDFSFNRGTTAALVGDQNLSKIINMPSNQRRFYAHMLDIIATTYNSAYVTYWANHYDDFCPGQSFAGVPAYVQARADFAVSTINGAGGNSPFAINGGAAISVSNNLVTFTGTAPVRAVKITVNGIEYAVTWSSVANWSLSVPVANTNTTLVFEGWDLAGARVPGASNVVDVNYSGPAIDPRQALVINEIMYRPAVSNASYVEIFNRSTNLSFDLSGWRVSGIDYTFPQGTIITNRQFLVLAKDQVLVSQVYGGVSSINVFDQFDGNLDPEGEKLALIKSLPNGDEQEVCAVHYEAFAPWPDVIPGRSLQLIDASQDISRVSNWSDGSGWRFVSLTGTPGVAATNFGITMDAAGDFYMDDFSLVVGSVPGIGTNTFVNGDFESGSTSPWYAIGNHAGSSFSTAFHHSGNASMHVVATGIGSINLSAVGQILGSVASNTTYTLSFWYLPTTNGTGFNFRLTSGFRSLSSISLRPAIATPGVPNGVTAPLEPFPLVWINEVEPNNVAGLIDGFAEHDPWLELYNSGTNSISLDSFSLANNYDTLNQWSFPLGAVLAPGEFKVIFADGQPGQSSGNELHTSFRLDAVAGSVALSQNGRILDYINYTNVDANYSFGSFPDGQLVDRQQFYYVTPGAPNNGSPVPVIINEWLASNTNNITDPATGKYEDWIELYNFGATPIDLSGYFLTDNTGNKKQWAFPAGTIIGPGNHMLVWADNAATNSTPSDLHAGFALSRNGELIALYTPDLRLVDRIDFGPQANNVSQGRYPDGNFAGVLHFMTVPTPGAANVVPANLSAPVLPAIANISVNEGSLLTFTNLATDADSPAQTLTYTLDAGAPSGATVDPHTGVFRWIPAELQGGAIYSMTVRVSDNGSPTLTDSKSFSATVNKVNSPPIVPSLLARSIAENASITFTVTASDSDIPVQSLSFSLDPGAPVGAAIDPVTGVFTWTPGEAQGPSTNIILVRVTDSGSPAASNTQPVTITVTEVNSQPVLANPGPVTIDEGKLFTYQLSATDSDLPTNRLSFSTFGAIPSGLIVNSLSGILSWTPIEAQGPSTNLVTVRVSDNGSPSMNMTQQFTIVVSEVNIAPVLTNLNNSIRTINELSTIILTNRATDVDVPTNSLTYEIVAAPLGAALNPTNGVLTWTPSESQGPSSNNIVIRVLDNGVPSLSATQRFSILVSELNTAPNIAPIADQTVGAGQLLTFSIPASDPDLPAQVLSFNLEPGAPSGAAIDPGGLFSWTPPAGTAPATNQVTVRVADDGVPSLSATQTFKVIVTFAVRITEAHKVDATHLAISFATESGKIYRVDFRDDFGPGSDWQAVPGSGSVAGGSSDVRTVDISETTHRFYRIVQTN